MVKKFSTWIIKHRLIVIGIIGLVTLFFGWQLKKVEVKTIFNDLLPLNHPFIKVHQKYVNQLGDPLKVLMMLKVKQGNIYNPETLSKIQRITTELDLIPGVNHNQIFSIASHKIKKVIVTADAILIENMMGKVPQSREDIERLRHEVRNTGGVYGIWVSADEKAALFSAGFIADLINYQVVLNKVNEIIAKESDNNHDIYACGEPLLTGWVFKYSKETYTIFLVTLLVLFLLLFFYFRNLIGILVPFLCPVLGAIWGLGFYGVLGYNIEPLTLVIPLLISARALSHAVQITERYFECYEDCQDKKTAAINASISILPPGFLGIVTDALGIFLIAVAPIPIMQKLAYTSSFWAISLIFVDLILCPVLLSFLPPPKNISDIVNPETGWEQKVIGVISKLVFGKPAVYVCIVGLILFILCGYLSSQVKLGDIHPGTPMLWQDSEYNISVGEIGKSFPGTEELYVIFEGSQPKAIRSPEFLRTIHAFQLYMERRPLVTGSLSLGDLFPPIYKAIYGGYPKKDTLPISEDESGQLLYLISNNSSPGDFDRYFNPSEDMINVVVWYRDHRGDTLRSAIADAKKFLQENKEKLAKQNIKLQLASGNVGILAAVNQSVKDSQLLNFILVMGITFLLCALTYNSFWAAVLLLIPLNLANLITLSLMKFMAIGLNINTLPIVSVGVGVGIDYGIYLLSRLCEECQSNEEISFKSFDRALRTTGKAIFFTASTMVFGVVFWYFLSSLRFQAEMGLLLACIMFINMVGAMLLLPALVYVFKPKFILRSTLLVKEK